MPPLTNSTATSADLHTRRGIAYGTSAYIIWGAFPAYWPLLVPATPTEILAHRVAWSLGLMLIVISLLGRWRAIIGLSRGSWLAIGAASVLISINWGVYIYAVNSQHVVESALGYFITPLISVLLGVVVLRERLGKAQLVAIAVAAVAVVVLTVDYGRLPWISLVLAGAFGFYALIKKMVPLDATSSLAAESMVIGPIAIGYLLIQGTTFTTHGTGHALLLAGTGVITVVPLWLFGAGARRVPLATMGMLQYLAPILQFAWGVFVVHEPMPASRWIGFGLVWVALAIFTVDAIRRNRRRQLLAPVE
ncbi:EamA family transporter RarD [Lentzea tibetensis]|uniref:EamA family transporter RarD n=1 Tax=Lentzea tibetensis TaxID=2591470 RepID=A0A563ELF2_9PSEU|nr:EamA family transporter RarD [Lentzea tibetensis]TWP47838.1 EamA family transporter RarD [Lentzea tibetensis]